MQENLLENEPVIVPSKLQDNFPDFYRKIAKIPLKLSGKANFRGTEAAEIFVLPEIPSFPGLLLELQENDISYVAIELKDSAKTIYELKKSVSKENPLELKASLFVLFTDDEFSSKNKRKGWLSWDGQTLIIKEKDGIFGKKILFESNP